MRKQNGLDLQRLPQHCIPKGSAKQTNQNSHNQKFSISVPSCKVSPIPWGSPYNVDSSPSKG